MFGLYKYYFSAAVLLFIVEILIGRYVRDAIIRPYGGDFLVVILLYCLVKSFFNFPIIKTAIGVLLFAYLVEVSQYFHLITFLGWQQSKLARIILGTSFSFIDLLTYTLGIMLVIIVEYRRVLSKLKNGKQLCR